MNVLKPFCAAVPWITLGVLLFQMFLVSGTYSLSNGTLFDLPDGDMAEGVATRLVALVMPAKGETLVFFDDTRYVLDDAPSSESLCAQLAERSGRTGEKVLLALADRRVPGGELMRLASIARKAGIEKILFAEKKSASAIVEN